VFQFLDLSSFAEQMLVHEGAIVKIRDDMPLDRAALIGCGVTTGLGAVLNTAGVRAGETVAVVGCGGVGLSAIQGAAIAGAGRIIAVDMVDSKLKLAESLGATDLVNAKDVDAVGTVVELTAAASITPSRRSASRSREQAFGMIKNGGTATVIGMIPIGQNVEIPASSSSWRRRSRARTWARTSSASTCPATSTCTSRAAQPRRHDLARIPLDEINARVRPDDDRRDRPRRHHLRLTASRSTAPTGGRGGSAKVQRGVVGAGASRPELEAEPGRRTHRAGCGRAVGGAAEDPGDRRSCAPSGHGVGPSCASCRRSSR
jgi:hypothetical protein